MGTGVTPHRKKSCEIIQELRFWYGRNRERASYLEKWRENCITNFMTSTIPPNTNCVIKKDKTGDTVRRTGKGRNVYKILIGKHEGTR
jgi:hypothetical protein